MWGTDKVHITVEAGLYDRINCIVAADISSIDQLSKGLGVSLYETVGEERREVACQLLEGKDGKPYLYWVLTGKTPAGTMREFVVEPITGNNEVAVMKIEDTGKALVLKRMRVRFFSIIMLSPILPRVWIRFINVAVLFIRHMLHPVIS